MLNKKTLFNGVYALALFGAITSCIGILNELLNLLQLYDRTVINLLNTYGGDDFWIPVIYQLVTFVLCCFTVIVLILYITNILKEKHIWIPNMCIIITCVIIFVLSFTLIYQVENANYVLKSFHYTTVYAFRTVVLSYIVSVGTVLFCNITESISKKRGIENHTEKETQG